MKIPRVKIYLSIKQLILACFKDAEKSRHNIENIFKDKLDKKSIIFTGMCRSAFMIVLDYLKEYFPEKNEIIICSYNLKEMIDVARLKEFKVIFIDIDKKTGLINLEKVKYLINNKTSALLYTNMFNDHCILKDLKKICNQNKILLIEDSAIYYGNYTDKEGKRIMAGSFGDVSLLSFGIMKNISALYGGALATSNENLTIFAKKKIDEYDNFSKLLYLKQIILFFLLKFLLSKYVYNLFFYYIIKISSLKEISLIQKLIYPSMKFKIKDKLPKSYYSKISNTSIKLIDQLITDKRSIENEIIRKKNNKIYFSRLKTTDKIMLFPLNDINFQNLLDFPIVVKNKKGLINYLFKNGIEVRSFFYDNCEVIVGDNNNINAANLEKNLICLPSHSNMNEKAIFKICNHVNKFYLN